MPCSVEKASLEIQDIGDDQISSVNFMHAWTMKNCHFLTYSSMTHHRTPLFIHWSHDYS